MKEAATHSRIVLIFVDGLGLGISNPAVNPIHTGVCPFLEKFLAASSPIDAQLGVPGIPQSATGQTTLLTGVNAAAILGRHAEGFPGSELRKIISTGNVLKSFIQRGQKAAFANAYYLNSVDDLQNKTRIQSVTTVATLSALGNVRTKDELNANRAVYHDLTRRLLVARGYEGPVISPAEAAEHLLGIAFENDLTLFEYFLTDRAGHQADMEEAQRVLCELNEFLNALCAGISKIKATLALTSDHGNIEDISTRSHTKNSVPFAVVGPEAGRLLNQVRSLTDITPVLLG